MAAYPIAAAYLNGQRLPGDIPPQQWDGFHDLIVIDELARCGYLGIVWALGCGNSIGLPPVVRFGSNAQKQEYLPDVLSGKKRFCLGVTEPDGTSQYFPASPSGCFVLLTCTTSEADARCLTAGSDVAGITTTATKQGSSYIVEGAKKWITNGIFADYCTAAVRTGGEGSAGISALIIPLKTPGVTCKKIDNSGVLSSGRLTYLPFIF